MPAKLSTLLTFLALIAHWGCAAERRPQARIVLEIADRPVTLEEFDRFVRTSSNEESPVLSPEVLAALFEEFIEEQLLLRAADDAGIRADPAMVAERLAALRLPSTSDSGATASEVGVPSADEVVARNVEKQVRIEKLVSTEALAGVVIEDDEIAEYYETHRDDFVRPETVDVSQILVESEEDARELRQTILSGRANFEDLAREHSLGPEAGSGGNLGAFARGELPPSFDEAIFELEPGALSNVVSTDFGFHLFRVNARAEERPISIEDAREAVRVELLRRASEEAMRRYVAALEKRYPLTVHPEHLSFSVARGSEGSDRAMIEETVR